VSAFAAAPADVSDAKADEAAAHADDRAEQKADQEIQDEPPLPDDGLMSFI